MKYLVQSKQAMLWLWIFVKKQSFTFNAYIHVYIGYVILSFESLSLF